MMVFLTVVRNVEIKQAANMIGARKLDKEKMIAFKEMVDQCVLDNIDNPKMKQGFEAIDEWAREQDMDFYELMINLFSPEELEYMIEEYTKDREEAEKDK